MTTRIYKPCKTAMQSGTRGTKDWVLEFVHDDSRFRDPIMGWVGSCDTVATEVKMHFKTKEEAIRYATSMGLDFEVCEPNLHLPRKSRPYISNYRYRGSQAE